MHIISSPFFTPLPTPNICTHPKHVFLLWLYFEHSYIALINRFTDDDNINVNRSLCSKGPYNRVRVLLDVRQFYYLAGEYMSCIECKGTYISWEQHILEQLPDGVCMRFPVVMTHKFTCDVAVILLLRSRTLRSSSMPLQNNILELHSEEWSRHCLWYMSDCERHKRGCQLLNLNPVEYYNAPPLCSLPTYKCLLACYVKDVWDCLPLLKASMTSVYGEILKIDSTK